MTRQEELHKIKMIPLLGFLQEWGLKAEKIQGKHAWFKALNRTEKTPSVCIYTKSFYDDYYDYGAKEGGSIIDFCQKQMSMSYIETMKLLRKYIK